MKPHLLFFLLPFSSAMAEEAGSPGRISGLVDGSEVTRPAPTAAFSPGVVLDSTSHPSGGRKIIVQQLALDPARPIRPAADATDDIPSSADPLAAGLDAAPGVSKIPAAAPVQLIHVSATVHPGPLTRFRWVTVGGSGRNIEHSGWSNVDFHHLSGFTSFGSEEGGRYALIIALGRSAENPETAPAIASGSPAFVTDSDLVPEALAPITALHELYAAEAPRLKAAHEGRERARLIREAELLANPPRPKDLIIRYRAAETPLATGGTGGDK